MCSEKGLNSKRASWHCQRLFHCLLLKKKGIQVFECLIYDIDPQYLHVFLEEFNTYLKIRIMDDPRFESTFFYEDSIKLAVSFKKQDGEDSQESPRENTYDVGGYIEEIPEETKQPALTADASSSA